MHLLHNINHDIEKVCKYPKCKRLGSPRTCKECGNKSRQGYCPKHRKIKDKKLLGIK